MVSRIKNIMLIFIMLITATAGAQDNGLAFSQYWVNGLAINPAYSGSREVFNITMVYQNKWSGIEGAPTDMTFSGHAPLKNERVALGVFIMNQSFGIQKSNHAYLNYAYRIPMAGGKFSLGLKAGVSFINEDIASLQSGLDPLNPDPAFTQAGEKRVEPGVGFGAYYYNKRFFIGASVPDMMNHGLNVTDSVTASYEGSFSPENYTYLLTAGVLIGKSEAFKWKPSFLLGYRADYSALRYDINNSFIFFDNRFWIGVSYRSGGSYPSQVLVGNIELYVNNQLMIGYAYDYALGGLNSALNGVHEIILRYEFGYEINAANPRFF